MTVLVTGATGYLGTALCARLEALGQDVVRLSTANCDLRRADSLSDFNSVQLEHIFHLAAWTQAGDFCLYHPGEQWIINQQINTNVLAWWQQYQPQAKMIAIGTSCAYAPEQPLSEDQYLVGQPIASLFTYAMTKRMLRIGLLALEKQYGLRHLTVVPSTLYGPGYHTDGRQMHFIFDLMRKIIRGKLFGDEVVLWGDGYQRRELIYLPDFVALLLRLVDGDHDLVNIGAGEEHSIRDFARLVCQEVGYSFDQIKFDTSRYVGARSKCLDISRLKTLVPDFELTPLQEGLAETVRWFMSKQDVLLAPTRE